MHHDFGSQTEHLPKIPRTKRQVFLQRELIPNYTAQFSGAG